MTSSPDTITVQLGLATFQRAHTTNMPVLILFVAAQRFFVSSIANTGIR